MFNEQSLQFQEKIMERSGLGDETYLPEGTYFLGTLDMFCIAMSHGNCLYHNSVSAICRLDHWSISAIHFHHLRLCREFAPLALAISPSLGCVSSSYNE